MLQRKEIGCKGSLTVNLEAMRYEVINDDGNVFINYQNNCSVIV